MNSKILIVLVLGVLLLSACQPAQTSAPSASTPSEATEAASAEAPQAAEVTAEPPKATLPLAASGEPMNGCRVTGSQLEPNPTLAALFPAVSEADWVKGPSDARVTILDFSDFQ